MRCVYYTSKDEKITPFLFLKGCVMMAVVIIDKELEGDISWPNKTVERSPTAAVKKTEADAVSYNDLHQHKFYTNL